MSLRLRLIVAFFLFSVVPLAAVTFYSYISNLRALQVAAQHETEMLTGELTQRMQVVTRQVSDRVERLMDMPAAASTPTVAGTSGKARAAQPRTVVARSTHPAQVAAPAAPAPPPAPEVPAIAATAGAIDARAIEGQVAGALGEVAMLLNNVEVRGLGRLGGRSGGPQGSPAPGGRTSTEGARSLVAPGAAAAEAALRAGTSLLSPFASDQPVEPGARGRGGNVAAAEASGREGDGRRGQRHSGGGGRPDRRPADPAAPGAERGAPASGPPDPNVDPTHIKIDLAPIRRELFREMAPSGTLEKMTPEERQRVGREVNQRLLGIVQGLQLTAAEIQKKAEAAKQQAAGERAASAAAAAKPLAANPLPPALPGAANVPAPKPPSAPLPTGATPPTPPAANVRPTPRTAAPEKPDPSERPERPEPPERRAPPERREKPEPPEKPMTKKAALTGTQLNVRFERDGEVVQQVNAEINLPNLLATVFANTRRDSGEIPFAVGKDGHLYAPNDADRAKLATLDVSRVDETPGTKRIGNWIVVTMPDRSGAGLRFGIARPVGDLLNDLRRTTARNAGFGLLFIAIALAGMVPLSGRLTRNLTDLKDGVGRIAQGDYRARVPVKSRDEIGRLAAAFNRMASDVEQHQRSAVEQERIRRELELGRRIQADMLPRAPLHFGLTEVKGISVPAREVGGDFFNYFQLDSGLVALLVGDVSGKGVGAALLMANIQASLRTRFALGQGLSAIAEAIDRDIEANSPGPVYATLFIAIFDPATRLMRYVNAGHNPQFVLRHDRPLEKLSSTGLPVGMLAGHGYREREVQLAPGDLLFFYTDGCVEMENEAGDMFGSDRLESLVAAAARGSAEQVLATVEGAIAAFRGGRDLFDDATMMAVTVG
jgi:serine phosphatase RsbU (regulator of sigma subunit)